MEEIGFYKGESGAICLQVNGISEELKTAVRDNLSAICNGFAKVTRNSELYSYKKTLGNFLQRYDKKSQSSQKGIIGELLTHVLVLHFEKNFKAVSPLFNLEEEGNKKGFDLVLRDANEKTLWFAEVKSGDCGKKTSDQKLGGLLTTAKNSLKENLNSDRYTLWQNAINGASIVIENGKLKEQLIEVLEASNLKALEAKNSSKDYNAILVAVCYAGNQSFATDKEFEARHTEVQASNDFKSLISVSVQKDAHDSVVVFLREEHESGKCSS
ncbi:MAG: hypothetical protein DHS20C08_16140 [Rhodomicrobium sp.]|nr:MAG: hypothetical protein DHS20C08_16140 [Rhodomicrobium sp.]